LKRVFLFAFLFVFSLFNLSFSQGLPKEGEKIYTIQLASVDTKKEALKLLEKIKGLPAARACLRGSYYRVRVGFFKSRKEAKEFAKRENLSEQFPDYYITQISFTPRDIIFADGKEIKEVKKSKPQPQKEEEKKPPPPKEVPAPVATKAAAEKPLKAVNESKEREPTKEQLEKLKEIEPFFSYEYPKLECPPSAPAQPQKQEKESSRWPLFFLFLLFAGIAGALGWYRYYAKGEGESRVKKMDFEEYILSLLERGDYEKVIEAAPPYLLKNPNSTFIKKALAEAYEKMGDYFTAASLYEELAQELSDREYEVLAKLFREKAEKRLSP